MDTSFNTPNAALSAHGAAVLKAPTPQFSASSTNRHTAHLAGRRRQPLKPKEIACR